MRLSATPDRGRMLDLILREARKLMLLATGAGKAGAIAAAVEGPFSPDCPARLLQDHPDITFLVDRGAGSKLKKKG